MSRYTDYLIKLKSVCDRRKMPLAEIGRASSLPIFKITLNPPPTEIPRLLGTPFKKGGTNPPAHRNPPRPLYERGKFATSFKEGGINPPAPFMKGGINPAAPRVVVFSAGIHGDEIAGPLAIIDFLRQFNFQDYRNVKIILFPVASPTAFDKKKRYNYLGKDLNDLFCGKKLSGENKILFQQLKNEKVFFFHALHEDDEHSFYLYNFENKKEKVYRDIIRLAKNYFPINNAAKIHNNPAVGGLITNVADGSFEDRMFRDGAPYSMCTETPAKQPLKKRIALNVKIMSRIADFARRQALLANSPLFLAKTDKN